MEYCLTRLQLYELLKEKRKWDQKYENAASHVLVALELEGQRGNVAKDVKKQVIFVCTKIKERLQKAGRSEAVFSTEKPRLVERLGDVFICLRG